MAVFEMPEPERHDDQPSPASAVEFPVRPIYRALLVRGLEPSEAANLTAWLAGLPCAGLHWTIPEVDAVLRRRAELDRRSKPNFDDLPPAKPLTWQTS
jgi:hypothetical protein